MKSIGCIGVRRPIGIGKWLGAALSFSDGTESWRLVANDEDCFSWQHTLTATGFAGTEDVDFYVPHSIDAITPSSPANNPSTPSTSGTQYKYIAQEAFWIIPGTSNGLRSRVHLTGGYILYERETALNVWEEIDAEIPEVTGNGCALGVWDGNWQCRIELTPTGLAGVEDTDWKVASEIVQPWIPQNLVVVDIVGGIRLTWETSAPVDGHEIWASVDGADYVLIDTVLSPTLTYDDTTDYLGVEVAYKIRSYKGTAYSDYTDEEEITLDPDILDLAVVWAEDHAVMTWDGVAGWETEIYSSLDNTNWTLDATIAAGTETYNNHCWQGTTVYFRARAKNGATYGAYCASINIAQTPIVFKFDCNPKATLTFTSNLGLAAGKTVRVSWGSFNAITGLEYYNNYTTTGTPTHAYGAADEDAQDPRYIKLSGDLNAITTLHLHTNVLAYGDIGKWRLSALTSLTQLYLYNSKLGGDLSGWVFPASLVDLRIYNTSADKNTFTGDLSSWALPAAMTICYTAYNAFTGLPRGELKNIEAAVAGFYARDCSCNTAAIDAFLAYANTYFATNTPVKNSLFQLANNFTSNMGIPTGGNSNTDIVGIKAKYVAAGFTATVTVRTS